MSRTTVCKCLFVFTATVVIELLYSRRDSLILVNDTDWEIMGAGDYVLQDGDEIVFIAAIHG